MSGEANESKETAVSVGSDAKDNVPRLHLQEHAPAAIPHTEPPLDVSEKAENPSEQPDATSPEQQQVSTNSNQLQDGADSQQPEPSSAANTQRSATSTTSTEVMTLSAKFGLTVEEVASLRSVFKMFDEDESGSIDMGEMINVLKMLGMDDVSQEEVKAKFRKADSDNSGVIDLEEFCGMVHSMRSGSDVIDDGEALEIFQKKYFDRSHTDLMKVAKWCMKRQPFFDQFQVPLVLEMCKHMRAKHVKKKTWLLKQDEPIASGSSSLYCMLHGAAAVFQRFDDDDLTLEPSAPAPSRNTSRRPSGSPGPSRPISPAPSGISSAFLSAVSGSKSQRSVPGSESSGQRPDSGVLSQSKESRTSKAPPQIQLPGGDDAAGPPSPVPATPSVVRKSKLNSPGQASMRRGAIDAARKKLRIVTDLTSMMGGQTSPGSGMGGPLLKSPSGMPAGLQMFPSRIYTRDIRRAASSPISPTGNSLRSPPGQFLSDDPAVPKMRKTCLPATTAHHKRAGLIGDYQVQSLDGDLSASYGESFNLQAMSASNGRLMGMLGRGDFVGQSGLVGASEKQPAGVYTIHDSQFLVLERRLFEIVLKQHPTFAAYRPSRLQSILRLPPPKRPDTEIAKIGQLLRPLEAFATINPDVLKKITRGVSVSMFPPGSIIVKQGHAGESMYVIVKGRCNIHEKVSKQDLYGDQYKSYHDSVSPQAKQDKGLDETSGSSKVNLVDKADAVSAAIRNRKSKIMTNMRMAKLKQGIAEETKLGAAESITADTVLKAHNISSLIFQDNGLLEETDVDKSDPEEITSKHGGIAGSLYSGDAFGEMAIMGKDLKHPFTVRALEPTILMTISRDLHEETMSKVKQEELDKAMAFLQLCPLTQGLATRTLHMLNVELERCEHAADSCFYLQGQAASGLFIIQEGMVTVYRNKRPDEMTKAPRDLTQRPEQGAVLGSKPPAVVPASPDVKPAEPTSEGGLGMPCKTQKLVEIAQLGPHDFFGEDSLPDGIHQSTVIAASNVKLLWLKPEALHHLTSKGINNVMRAAWMRKKWRGRRQEVLQKNLKTVAAASHDTPLLKEASSSSMSTGSVAQATQETETNDSGAWKKNAEAGMQTIMGLAAWADIKSKSPTKQRRKTSQAASTGPNFTARNPMKALRAPPTSNGVAAKAQGDKSADLESILADGLQEASWALNFCVRAGQKSSTVMSEDEIRQGWSDLQGDPNALPADVAQRHDEVGAFGSVVEEQYEADGLGPPAPPPAPQIHMGPPAFIGKKLRFAGGQRPTTAPVPSRTDHLARPRQHGGLQATFSGAPLQPRAKRDEAVRGALMRGRRLGGQHPEYAPVSSGETWQESGFGGYNAFVRSSTEIPLSSLQGPMMTRSSALETQLMGPAFWSIQTMPVYGQPALYSSKGDGSKTHRSGTSLKIPSQTEAARAASARKSNSGAGSQMKSPRTDRSTALGEYSKHLDDLRNKAGRKRNPRRQVEHTYGGNHIVYDMGSLRGHDRFPKHYEGSPVSQSEYPDIDILEQRISSLANLIHSQETAPLPE